MSANDCADICATSRLIQLQTVRVISGGGALCEPRVSSAQKSVTGQCPVSRVQAPGAITDTLHGCCWLNVFRLNDCHRPMNVIRIWRNVLPISRPPPPVPVTWVTMAELMSGSRPGRNYNVMCGQTQNSDRANIAS